MEASKAECQAKIEDERELLGACLLSALCANGSLCRRRASSPETKVAELSDELTKANELLRSKHRGVSSCALSM